MVFKPTTADFAAQQNAVSGLECRIGSGVVHILIPKKERGLQPMQSLFRIEEKQLELRQGLGPRQIVDGTIADLVTFMKFLVSVER